jgi:CheY-like chemotaxis protein
LAQTARDDAIQRIGAMGGLMTRLRGAVAAPFAATARLRKRWRDGPWPRRVGTAAVIATPVLTLAAGLVAVESALEPVDQAMEAARLGAEQRTASQTILYLATRIRESEAEAHRWDDLETAIRRFDEAYAALPPPQAEATLEAEMRRRRGVEAQSVDTLVRDYVIDAKTVFDGGEPAASEAFARMTRLGPDYLLTALDRLVGVYDEEAERAAFRARMTARAAGAATLLATAAAAAAAWRRRAPAPDPAIAPVKTAPVAEPAPVAPAPPTETAALAAMRQAVSEQVRRGLSGAIAMAELALDDAEDAEARRRLSMIRSACEGVVAEMPDLLEEAGKAGGAKGAAFSPTELARRAVAAVAGQAALRDVVLYVEPEPGLSARYAGDPDRLRAILVAVLNHMMTGGGAEPFQVRIAENGAKLRFTVVDPASSLDAASTRGLIESERPRDAAGAALVAAAQLAARLGGRISATGDSSGGVAISIEAPCERTAGGGGAGGDLRDFSIVVADANPINRRAVAAALELGGASVFEAANAAMAIDRAAQGEVSLVVAAADLPKLGGASLIEAIRDGEEVYAKTPILLLSAELGAAARRRHLQAGVNGVLSLPYDIDTLQNVAGEIARGGGDPAEAEEEEGFIPMDFGEMDIGEEAGDDSAAPESAAEGEEEEDPDTGFAPMDLSIIEDVTQEDDEALRGQYRAGRGRG